MFYTMKQIVVTRKISSQLIEWLACVAGNRIHELVIFGVRASVSLNSPPILLGLCYLCSWLRRKRKAASVKSYQLYRLHLGAIRVTVASASCYYFYTWFRVQFGINLHKLIFQKVEITLAASASANSAF